MLDPEELAAALSRVRFYSGYKDPRLGFRVTSGFSV